MAEDERVAALQDTTQGKLSNAAGHVSLVWYMFDGVYDSSLASDTVAQYCFLMFSFAVWKMSQILDPI